MKEEALIWEEMNLDEKHKNIRIIVLYCNCYKKSAVILNSRICVNIVMLQLCSIKENNSSRQLSKVQNPVLLITSQNQDQ